MREVRSTPLAHRVVAKRKYAYDSKSRTSAVDSRACRKQGRGEEYRLFSENPKMENA
jgi:hypothetical protein